MEVEEKQRPYFIPFWRIKVRIGGWPRQARAFLSPGAPCSGQGQADEEERYFWLPAFKISPSLFLNLSKAVSFRQPSAGTVAEKIPKGTYYPVTLSWDQAKEGLTAIVTGIIRPHLLSKIPQLKVEPIDHLLVFIPFHWQGSELVQEKISVGIYRNALHFGRFL